MSMRSIRKTVGYVLAVGLQLLGVAQASAHNQARQYGQSSAYYSGGSVELSTNIELTIAATADLMQEITIQATVTEIAQVVQTVTEISMQQMTISSTVQNYITISQVQTVTETVGEICTATSYLALATTTSVQATATATGVFPSAVAQAISSEQPESSLTIVIVPPCISCNNTTAVNLAALPSTTTAATTTAATDCACQCLCPAAAWYSATQMAGNISAATAIAVAPLSTFQTVASAINSNTTTSSPILSTAAVNVASVLAPSTTNASIAAYSMSSASSSDTSTMTAQAEFSTQSSVSSTYLTTISAQADQNDLSTTITASGAGQSSAPFDISTYQLSSAVTVKLGG